MRFNTYPGEPGVCIFFAFVRYSVRVATRSIQLLITTFGRRAATLHILQALRVTDPMGHSLD